mmetsp:Transcript_42080/g.88326  ORF Transcript_42080/g.88326 Transcript_42080/m.88326 type:complete len:84 (+) Transcript_42080:341-592(+)
MYKYIAIGNDYAITLYTNNAAAVSEMLNDNFWPTGILSYWYVTTAQPLLPLDIASLTPLATSVLCSCQRRRNRWNPPSSVSQR